MRRLGVLGAALCAVLVLTPEVRADDATRIVLKAGGEYDTNANRVVASEPIGDELVRLFLKADAERDLGPVGRVDLKLLMGAKLYEEVDGEDAFVTAITVSWGRLLFALGEGLPWMGVYVRGDFGDRSERRSRRDYMRGGGVAGLQLGWGPVALSGGGGYRAFVYKPDLSSNHHGATAEAGVSVDIWEALRARATYVFIERDFDVERFIEVENAIRVDDAVLREDSLHATRLELAWRGSFLLSGAYGTQINRSNSFGPGLVRHIGELSWTQPLWLDMRLSVTGRIQRTLYDDAVRIDETLQIDDENRNQLVVGLNVPIPPVETGIGLEDILGLELRYSLYTEALGGDEADFVRHLIYAGLSAELDPLLQ